MTIDDKTCILINWYVKLQHQATRHNKHLLFVFFAVRNCTQLVKCLYHLHKLSYVLQALVPHNQNAFTILIVVAKKARENLIWVALIVDDKCFSPPQIKIAKVLSKHFYNIYITSSYHGVKMLLQCQY